MFLVLTEMSTFTSIIKLFLLLVLFFVLLYGAHLFTKWYAKSGYVNAKSSNIQIIETQQVVPGKSIVIVKVGEKYIAFLLMKDNAVFLTELSKDELSFDQVIQKTDVSKMAMNFTDVFQKVKNYNHKKKDQETKKEDDF